MSAPDAPSRWARARRLLKPLFFLLVLLVIGHAARAIDWPQVWTSLKRIPASHLLLAALCSGLSYFGYAFTDLFALKHMEGRVSRPRAMSIAFVSYVFNQNFGSLLGTIGFRLRLYSHDGLQPAQIAPIVGMGFITNWSGYLLLIAGTLRRLCRPYPPDGKPPPRVFLFQKNPARIKTGPSPAPSHIPGD